MKEDRLKDEPVLEELWRIIEDRASHPAEGSYVSSILRDKKGVDKALEKLGEECIEYVLAAKNGVRERTVAEGADLLFHFMIALYASGVTLDEILKELARRRK
jgi:phosphoribosyl-ATP pyrophosphohydrolase